MSSFDFDLVAIGSGPAGQRAAVQASKLGKRAAVVEKRPCVGQTDARIRALDLRVAPGSRR
jgi:pyruvate/2-oxoglutarate dehydrogenase complex dihydrolipoamide dehydrogenase (E3) component